jgi:hypothetical protein
MTEKKDSCNTTTAGGISSRNKREPIPVKETARCSIAGNRSEFAYPPKRLDVRNACKSEQWLRLNVGTRTNWRPVPGSVSVFALNCRNNAPRLRSGLVAGTYSTAAGCSGSVAGCGLVFKCGKNISVPFIRVVVTGSESSREALPVSES